MKKALILFIASLPLASFAQNEVDALRYSMLNYQGGTARFSGMGSSFGALGGDFSSIGVNPACLGIYRKPEFTFTPSLFTQSTGSTFNGSVNSDSKMNFNFSNVGIVFAHAEHGDEQEWKGVGFSFGYTGLSNFNNRINISGISDSSSLLDIYQSNAYSQNDPNTLDPFGAQLAWNTWLIDTLTAGNYYHVIPNYGQNVSKTVESRGTMGETFFAIAGNYANKLFIGGSFGLPHIRYVEESTYSESVQNDTVFNLESYTLKQNLTTTGAGFNVKLGVIFKPVDFIRIGGSFHSPSMLEMTDTYNSKMESHFTSNDYSSESPDGAFDYTITTPLRLTGSLGVIIKKFAAINVDYEYVDYSSSRLSAPFENFTDANAAIRAKYTSAGTLRVGAEFKLAPLSLRAGYAMSDSPYKPGVNDGKRNTLSFGFGIREKNTFIDFAYVMSETTEDYYMYDPKLIAPASLNSKATNYQLTAGFKF